MSLEYRILGPVEVWAGGRKVDIGGARQRRLIGALILAGGRPVDADRLVDIVWVGRPPAMARNTLRTYIARARRALEDDGDSPVLTDPIGWRLERPDDALDATRFESLLASAKAMSADPMAALTALEEARSLWRDDALVEFSDEDWCAGEAARLDELRLAAEEERFEAMLGCGLYDDVVGELERFTERHPLRDRPRAQQMMALYLAGRQVEAVRAFQDYRRLLRDEIGVEASDELRSLEQRIIRRDPSLQRPTPDVRRLRGYQLGPMVGQGAFGRIHRATQPSLGREVAIKVIRPELADDPEFIRRFDGEARTIARLEHPHIVPLFDYWREPGGAYLVMRYLKGGSARDLLETSGQLSVQRVARILEQIGSALAVAHAAGVVHRDVKPANILFDEQGNTYLGDFGIAVGVGDPPAAVAALTDSSYASPEQLRGEATPRSDVFALGVVLYELLTGRVPAPGNPWPAVGAVRSDVPSALDDVIGRATASDPDLRYDDVGDLVSAFRAVADPSGTARPLAWAVRNPYKGLAAFDEADALDFHGRDELVDQLEDATLRSRFVAVVGPSGSGKSSVVRAGLAPRLRHRGAFVSTMMPGARPMDALTRAILEIAPASYAGDVRAALADPARGLADAFAACFPDERGGLVLIVDQFEELFTLTDDADRKEFLRTIASTVRDDRGQVTVIATIRADFYDRPLDDERISELVRANTVAVGALGAAELAQAIVAPAARVGVTVEPALVAALVADASGARMALPLVQYELTSLFDGRGGDALTIAAYRRHGGLGAAIARRAEEVLSGFDEADRDAARRLFGRLVVPGERDDDARRRVRTSELTTVPPEVVDAYVDARLLTIDRDGATREPTVEIAHEALIREWPRLRSWVDADRDGLRTLRHLTGASTSWDTAGRDPGELYRGGRLLAAEEWASGHDDELNQIERTFLDESVAARDAEGAREQRRLRRLRVLVVSLGVVACVAIASGLVAARQSRIADDHAAEAERRALENRVAQLVSASSLARVESDPDLAILLALAAHEVSSELADVPGQDVVAALHEAVQASRLERIIEGGYSAIAVSPDGRTVALDHLGDKRRVATYDTSTGELLRSTVLDGNIGGLAYSPDGSTIAVTFCCTDAVREAHRSAMMLLDADTLETVGVLDGGAESWNPSWSGDGSHVSSSGWAGVRVWRPGVSEAEQTIADTEVADLGTFLPGSNTIAIAGRGRLELVDTDSGATIARHAIPVEIKAFRVAPDASRAAFVDALAETVEVIDLESGASLHSFGFASPEELQFSPDGRSLAISGNSETVRVVDLGAGGAVELHGHGAGVIQHAYAPDGRLLVSMREGGTRVWNLSPAGPPGLGNLSVGGRARSGRAISDTSLLVAVETGVEEGRVDLVDIASDRSETIAEFWFPGFGWPVFSPGGELVAGYSRSERIAIVVDVRTRRTVAALRTCETARAVDHANGWVLVDGFCLDAAQQSERPGPRTGFVDLASGDLISDPGSDAVFDAAIGPPGSISADVVAYTTVDRLVFRSTTTLETLAEWIIPADVRPLSMEFSPDGSSLGLSSQHRQGVVFDVAAILAGGDVADAAVLYPELHPGPTHRVVPIGDSIVTTGAETQVRQWDAATASLLVDVSTDLGQFVQLFAMPDRTTLFYADKGGVLRRYLADPDDVVALARTRVQRGFTTTECLRWFLDGSCPS